MIALSIVRDPRRSPPVPDDADEIAGEYSERTRSSAAQPATPASINVRRLGRKECDVDLAKMGGPVSETGACGTVGSVVRSNNLD